MISYLIYRELVSRWWAQIQLDLQSWKYLSHPKLIHAKIDFTEILELCTSCCIIFSYLLLPLPLGVEAHRYIWNSYSKYTILKRPVTWFDRYITNYMVQVRTLKENGVILYEEGSRYSRAQQQVEFSTLEVRCVFIFQEDL